MFTVLIAEKEHIDAICRENKLFFEPFLENKELAFCEWNPAGQSLAEAVPGLYDIVGRQRQWRAVIVNTSTPELIKTQNPFDAVNYQALKDLKEPPLQLKEGDDVDQWEALWKEYFSQYAPLKETIYKNALELPLQKLSTWLCFRPEDYILNTVEEKMSVEDWAMEELRRKDSEKDDEEVGEKTEEEAEEKTDEVVNEENTDKLAEEKKQLALRPGERLERLFRDQYKREHKQKELIRRAFTDGELLNIAYPAEIQCVSLRTADNKFFDPDAFWTVRQESEYSTFADRNMYFDKMRFMVFDLLPKTHRDFRNDYIRFMAFLLILATNSIPGSTMQARRLYRIEMNTDETPLRTLITSYDRKLAASYDVIQAEMEQIQGSIPSVLTDRAAETMFCTPMNVPVMLDESCDTEAVYADKDYGLFFDSPENEFQKWNRSYKDSEKALAFIIKQQGRAVRKSVSQMHFSSNALDVNISRLTPLQIEDIREYTDTIEDEMVSLTPPDLTDISNYTGELEKASEDVKKVIDQRMTRKATLTLCGICLGLFFICFLPFLLSNNGSMRITTTAVGLTAGMLGLMAAILVVTLLCLRKSVTDAVRVYNNRVNDVMNDVNGGLQKFSKYLSAASNVRRGHAVQKYAEKNVDEYTKALRIRKRHQEDIRKKRAYLEEEYKDYFGDHTDCDEVMSRPYEYDFGLKVEYTYPAPFLAGDRRQIEFMTGGNIVTVPSSYVTKVTVRMEGIYET